MPIPTLDVFQVIADPSRREMLHMLSQERMTINALAENFEMSRPAVSKHVKILFTAGFLEIEDVGRERYCSLRQDGFVELKDWMAYYDKFWSLKLNKLGDILDNRPKR